jgi:outer membrane protein TolC
VIALAVVVASGRSGRAEPVRTGSHAIPIRISIEQALELAEAASESVTAARAGVRGASARLDVARSELFPRLAASGSYERTLASEFDDLGGFGDASSPVDLPFGRPNAWRLGVSFSQWIWTGGRIASAIDAGEAGLDISSVELGSARALAVLDAARAYFDAALADRQVEIAELSLAQAEKTLADTRLDFELGGAPEYDVLRAEVSRDNQRLSLAQFRSRRTVAFAVLKRAIGLPLDRAVQLVGGLEDRDDIDALIRRARGAAGLSDSTLRAPVARAAGELREQRASLGIARSERWPRLSLFSDFGLVNYPEDVLPSREQWRRNWTVGLNVSFPIFDGGRIEGEVAAARADVAAASARLRETTELSQVDELETGTAVEIATATWRASDRTADLAGRAYQIAEIRFAEGASSQLELIEARFQQRQALLNEAQAARDVRVARLREALLPALPLANRAAVPGDDQAGDTGRVGDTIAPGDAVGAGEQRAAAERAPALVPRF